MIRFRNTQRRDQYDDVHNPDAGCELDLGDFLKNAERWWRGRGREERVRREVVRIQGDQETSELPGPELCGHTGSLNVVDLSTM